MSNKSKNQKPTASKAIGKQVTYNPNGQDFGTRPKNAPLAAIVVNTFEQTKGEGEKAITREVANLVVFVDAAPGTAYKQRVPHKKDALEGESFYE